ncbi:MAG: zinc-binding dehydrogenase [Spirochaetota bacterium]
MKAAVLYKNESHLKVEDVPIGEPNSKQVKVKIKCCGVCGSDIHITVHKQVNLKHYPRIMGHEASGVVESCGSEVSKFKVGDRVVISAGTSCGECKHCLAGNENFCEDVGVLGFDSDGAFAEYLLVEERYLYHLPDTIPFDQGAILADAVSTPYYALKNAGKMQENETVAIIGCGGLGVHGVALAKALGAHKVIAVDIDSGALQHAGMYGADEVVNVNDIRHIGKTLRDLGNVDLLCDFSGYYKNIEDSLRAMNSGGRMVLVGIGRNKLNISMPANIVQKQISIIGSLGANRQSIPELIDLYTNGKLDLQHSITSHHPLEEVNQCLEDLHHRQGNPIRFIIEP